MNRRNLLKALVAGTLVTSLPGLSWSQTKPLPWRNWSGNQKCSPAVRAVPGSVAELQNLVRESTGTVRAVGAGHSFSALVPTNDTIVSTRRLAGLSSVDPAKKIATLGAGTLLSEVGPLLDAHRQALVNMPDIDQQTLAGAISTATHGTGRELRSLSGYVDGLELVAANGELLRCSPSENPDLFRAAQVGLGSLGIVTSITMKNRAAFRLKREADWMRFEEVIEQAHALSRSNQHFEFFYFPFTGMVLTDQLNETNEPVQRNEEIDGNSGVMDLKLARDTLSWSPQLRELIVGSYMKTIGKHSNVDHSYAIYANDRNVRFNEMEYHLPAETAMEALAEVRSVVEKNFSEVFFPFECRFIAAEEAWLSPFYQQDTVSIAVHRFFEEDFKPMFAAVEPVFRKYGGRPHWGKLNTLVASDFAQLYPRWQDFLAVRESLDPQGKFLNPYLKKAFGLPV
ncbi:MAG: FAD-binding protein [Oleiphilus sp.]|nr:MAG: FAD-binding protein [Oleiphilus sp.]